MKFNSLAEKLEGDKQVQAAAFTLGAFCYFLALDIDKARETIEKVPMTEITDPTEQEEVKKLTSLLELLPATERETTLSGDKLQNKRNFHFQDFKTSGDLNYTAMLIAKQLYKNAPSFHLIEEKVKQAVCATNLRQLGVILFLYAQSHDGNWPKPYDLKQKTIWITDVLKEQHLSWKNRSAAFKCPSLEDNGKSKFSYGINDILMLNDSGDFSGKKKVLLLADSVHYMPGDYSHKPNYGGAAYKIGAAYEHSGTGTVDRFRHMGGANVLFTDGTVKWLPAARISNDSADSLWR